MEVYLDRSSRKRTFPAIDLARSGSVRGTATQPEELNKVWILRKVPLFTSPIEAMELLIEKLSATKSK